MCGIAGIISEEGATPHRALLEEMTALLAHRGPDGAGGEVSGRAAFGHRRLSIIDVEQGAQPMWSVNGSLLITYNGEIFNYLELRQELEKRGAQFRTRSDTEVILEAFLAWGSEAFSKFNGQFAFALYDKPQNKVYLVRDRMGEKPLYYVKCGRQFAFASELKSVLLFKERMGEANVLSNSALVEFLALNYVPFDHSLVEGVVTLTPGTFLVLDDKGATINRYWQPAIQPYKGTLENACDELQSMLLDAVRIRLRSDVPVGLFLSGGVDSSLLAHALAKQDIRLTAYIADFRDSGFSELKNAQLVCEKLGIPSAAIDIDPAPANLPELIERMVYHGDEPLADSSALPVYLLSRGTAKECKVVLSGEGGDELFGGYLMYRATIIARTMPAFLRRAAAKLALLSRIVPGGSSKVGLREMLERFLRNLDLPPGAAHFAWNGMFRGAQKLRLLDPGIIEGIADLESFGALATRLLVDLENPKTNELLLADQKNYLANDILAKTDRMSMAHGLEVRPAFIDHRIVEFARSLPEKFMVDAWQTKILPKKLVERTMPFYPARSRKQGFSIPVHKWFRTRLKDFADGLFRSNYVKDGGVYNQAELLKLWELHLSKRRDLGFELWGIMISLLWMKRFGIVTKGAGVQLTRSAAN